MQLVNASLSQRNIQVLRNSLLNYFQILWEDEIGLSQNNLTCCSYSYHVSNRLNIQWAFHNSFWPSWLHLSVFFGNNSGWTHPLVADSPADSAWASSAGSSALCNLVGLKEVSDTTVPPASVKCLIILDYHKEASLETFTDILPCVLTNACTILSCFQALARQEEVGQGCSNATTSSAWSFK